MERPDLITLGESLSRLDGNLTRRNLAHSNKDNAHQANFRVIGLNEDQTASRHLGEVGFGVTDRRGIRIFIKIGEVLGIIYRVISSRHNIGLHDSATDGAVPAMIGQSAEKGLIRLSRRQIRTRARRWLACRGWSRVGL